MQSGRSKKNQRNRRTSYNGRSRNYNSYSRNKKAPVKKDRFLNVMIFVVILALSYVTLDMLDVSLPTSVTSKIDSVFSSDVFSFGKAKDKVVSFVNNTASVFNGGKSTAVSSSKGELKLEMPVSGEVITKFEDKTHPVFNTTVKPRGIEIQTEKSEEVFASASGKVTNVAVSYTHLDVYKRQDKNGYDYGDIPIRDERFFMAALEITADVVGLEPIKEYSYEEFRLEIIREVNELILNEEKISSLLDGGIFNLAMSADMNFDKKTLLSLLIFASNRSSLIESILYTTSPKITIAFITSFIIMNRLNYDDFSLMPKIINKEKADF